MAVQCVEIAKPADLGGDAFFTELARQAGNPEIIETCDVTARYGESIYTEADIKKLFFQGQQTLAAPDAVKHALKFYDAMPTRAEITAEQQQHEKKDALGKTLAYLDFVYGTMRTAHEQFQIPYVFEGETAMLAEVDAQKKTLAKDSDITTAQHANTFATGTLLWMCGSPNFPEPFFDVIAEHLAAMTVMEVSTSGPITALFQQCLDTASPERKEQLTVRLLAAAVQMVLQFQTAINGAPSPGTQTQPALRVGDTLPPSALDAHINNNRVTVLMGWAEWCQACEQSLPIMQGIHKTLKENGDSVVTFRTPPDDPALLKKAQQDQEMSWRDVEIPLETMRQLNPSGRIPLFLVVDDKGTILFAQTGLTPTLEQDIRQAIATFEQQRK